MYSRNEIDMDGLWASASVGTDARPTKIEWMIRQAKSVEEVNRSRSGNGVGNRCGAAFW